MKNITINALIILFVLPLFSSGQITEEIKGAIGEYKRTFYQVSCKSALLESQLSKVEQIDYTVVKKCQSCKGAGKIKGENNCSNCGGLGSVGCSHCFDGSNTCTDCKGHGKIYCSCANQTVTDILLKSFHYKVNCSNCGGSSGGRGLLKCSGCNGNGRNVCSFCNGDGEQSCRSCKNGTVVSSVCCEECKGLGRLIE